MFAHRRSILTAVAVLSTFALASCGKSSTAPEVPAPAAEIKTPTGAKITAITLPKFPAKTQAGDDWDASLIVSARRPDLYAQLRTAGGSTKFISDTKNDAETSTLYSFSQPTSGSFPATIPYGNDYRLYLMDDDFASAPDQMGWITVNLVSTYKNDNATKFDRSFTDSGGRITFRVIGEWIYD